MPTLTTAWEPTLHERENNPGSPWVLVRGKCRHTEFFKERKRIKRFSTAKNAADFIVERKLNEALDEANEAVIIETIEDD